MCKHGTTVEVIIDGKSISIDSCIAEEVELINRVGKATPATLGSCCGHGIYHPTIIVRLYGGSIYEYYSGKIIPRKRNFYRKDAKGFYYLPEVKGRIK